MLTYPSDLLPQIVCPMDEDAVPPNPLCSAPPHSDPPLPLLSFSSITPSCANDGISGHRRSDRIQGNQTQTQRKQSYTVSRANKKPSRQNLSPTTRQREYDITVSQSMQQKVESAHAFEEQSQVGLDFTFPNENQKTQNEEKSPWNELEAPAAENVDEHGADNTTQNRDASASDMHTCGNLAVGHSFENASAPQGWLIRPLFQSFKSKMASFTEIVMSPAKLFTASSPPLSMDHVDKLTECELQDDGASDVEPSSMLQPVGQCETEYQEDVVNQQGLSDVEGSQNTKNGALNCSKKLVFELDLSTHSPEQTDECAITWKEKNSLDTVPLQDSPTPCIVSNQVSECVGSAVRSSVLIEPPVSFSALQETSLKISSPVEEQGKQGVHLKPLPRKCTGNRSEQQLSERNSVQSSKTDSCNTDRTQPDADNCQTDDENNIKNKEHFWIISNESTNGRSQKSPLDTQHLENQPNPDSYSSAGLGKSKRGMKISCHSQDLVKKKKTRAANVTEDAKNIDSGSCILMGSRPPRKEVVLTNITVDREETLKPLRKRQTGKIVNKKGEAKQKMFPKTNEGVLNMETDSSPNPMIICSLEKTTTVSQKKQKDSNSKAKPSYSVKRPKTRSGFGQPDLNVDGIDLETTVAITSTRQAQQEPLIEVHEHIDTKQLQGSINCRNINKKPLKRKSPIQASSVTESDCTLTSSIRSVVPLELSRPGFNASLPVQIEENLKTGLNPLSKRSKKGLRSAVKSSGSPEISGTCIDNRHLITKESGFNEESKNSADSAYFEMTQFESNHQTVPPPSQLNAQCYVNNEVKQVIEEKVKSPVQVADDAEASDHSSNGLWSLKSSARRVNSKAKRAVNQRRRCIVLHSRTHKGEDMTNSITMEVADMGTGSSCSSGKTFSRRLLRSYSCPEILSLHLHDTPWTTSEHSPQHSRTQAAHQHQSSQSPLLSHFHKFIRRARRHTVCSVEVEREIAPLCLRKEVYPSRRSASYDSVIQHLSPTVSHSPSTSLSALASCFLSSPLAFLSKKAESRGSTASPLASNQVPSPNSSSSLTSPLSSSTLHLPGFLQRSDSSQSTSDSSSSKNPLERETERRPQSEGEEDGEDTSLSSQLYEDVGLREEKALSDSEIKVVQKHEERGKVSSIRIRKTLPKPQNNLTPMGLPKPIRLKKKQFSLEEIYTNKNFSKPPESRLETIFEVPLSRRNGSESWFGQRRVKRFLEFLEVGEVRKPKKPLVGVGKAGISSSRTRRGGFTKEEPSLSVQDVDSLLCAKLDQLNLWLTHDQTQLTDSSIMAII